MSFPYANLKPSRKRSGFTQKELAFLIGTKKNSTISRHEAGDRCPDLKTAMAYRLLFGRELHELFPGVHAEVRGQMRKRAQHLAHEIGARGGSARITYKLNKLARLVNEASDVPAV
jgi:DNA-binding XRE family transcriptional regulator